MTYNTIKYTSDSRIARITLNRPDRLNAIDQDMPNEIADAVEEAENDDNVHVIILDGAGDAFCSGYDLKVYAERHGPNKFTQPMPWDPMRDYRSMKQNTDKFFRLWRCYKPTICKVHGYAIGGGSDIALSCDILLMSEDAKIGYPPARVWGCPTTAMWVYRLGSQLAKRMLFTGDLITGTIAADYGLALEAVESDLLEKHTLDFAQRISGVPNNQLMMQKLMINQALDNMGLENTQLLATLFDGITRHSPEGIWFKNLTEQQGIKQAIRKRDSGEPLGPGDA